MAVAAATFSESIPAVIGIRTRHAAPAVQRSLSPAPSVPTMIASFGCSRRPSLTESRSVAPAPGVSATVRNPSASEPARDARPAQQPGPGQREDGTHADLDRPSIERVGAARGQQRTVPAKRRGVPNDRADVGVIDDVLQDHQPTAVQQILGGVPLLAVERGERAAVDVESRHRLGELLADQVDRHVRPAIQHVGEPGPPAFGEQKGARSMSRLDRPADHQSAFGYEQSGLGLDERRSEVSRSRT